MDREAWRATIHGVARVEQNLTTKQQQCNLRFLKILHMKLTSIYEM